MPATPVVCEPRSLRRAIAHSPPARIHPSAPLLPSATRRRFSSAMVHLTTFGGLGLRIEDRPIDGALAQRRRLLLLAILASEYPAPVGRQRLGDLLWGAGTADAADAARNNLRQAIFALRHGLAELGEVRAPVAGRAELALDPTVVHADCIAFAAAIDARAYGEAVRLYRGHFLDGISLPDSPAFGVWADARRVRCAEQFRHACAATAVAAAADRRWEEALGTWLAFRTHFPADARPIEGLIEALVQLGRVDEAREYAHAYGLAAVLERAIRERASKTAGPPRDEAHVDAPDNPRSATPSPLLDRLCGPWRRRAVLVAGAAVLVLGAVFARRRFGDRLHGMAMAQAARSSGVASESAVAVLPFRVSSTTTQYEYLRDGMVDLLAATLTDSAARVRTIDAGATITTWDSTVGVAPKYVPLAEELAVARRLGAARIVDGGVVGTATEVTITAQLVDVATGTPLLVARVNGVPDRIATLVDGLAAQLLSGEAGDPRAGTGALAATPLGAVRAYLDGRAAFRRGDFAAAVRHEQYALAVDSTFALAALELGRVAGWLADDASEHRGYALAWAHRDRLDAIGAAEVAAVLGPRYPQGSTRVELLDACERLTRLEPDRPEPWYLAGDLLFHNPWLSGAGAATGLSRARGMFERALRRAPDYAPAYDHLIQLLAHERDTATLRREWLGAATVRLAPDVAAYLGWRVAVALDDSEARRRAWAQLRGSSPLALQWVIMSSQEDGVALRDAERAVQWMVARGVTGADRVDALRARHALALNEGDLRTAAEAAAGLRAAPGGKIPGRRLQLLDALFGGAPTDAVALAALAATRLSAFAPEATTPARREEHAIDGCLAGYWYAAHGQQAALSGVLNHLLAFAARHRPESWSAEAHTCATLLTTWRAVLLRSTDRTARLDALDRDLAGGAYVSSRLLWDATVLASASVFETGGEPARALSAIRRRNWFYHWPHYLAPQLEAQGRIALEAHDTAGAVRSYRHYIALRRHADPSAIPAVRHAQVVIALLGRQEFHRE